MLHKHSCACVQRTRERVRVHSRVRACELVSGCVCVGVLVRTLVRFARSPSVQPPLDPHSMAWHSVAHEQRTWPVGLLQARPLPLLLSLRAIHFPTQPASTPPPKLLLLQGVSNGPYGAAFVGSAGVVGTLSLKCECERERGKSLPSHA